MSRAPNRIGSPVSDQVSLDDLAQRIAARWAGEPCVGDAELLAELHRLDVDRLILRRQVGVAIQAAIVRARRFHYLWFRERWGERERVA